jgi:hypothetical protein
MSEAQAEIATQLSRRSILILTGTAVLAALLILFAAVLPAEYDRDPTGLGKLTGIGALWAPEEQVVTQATPAPGGAVAAAVHRSYPTAYKTIEVDIPLKASGDPGRGDEVEYKVRLKAGSSYVYSWSVAGIAVPEEFYTEFHGHTVAAGKAMTVDFYRKETGTSDNGVLTAPFDGVHGWYFQNQSVKPVTVKLRVSGFFDLIPAGQEGNEAGFKAKIVG